LRRAHLLDRVHMGESAGVRLGAHGLGRR
jgi:hypothetical protein